MERCKHCSDIKPVFELLPDFQQSLPQKAIFPTFGIKIHKDLIPDSIKESQKECERLQLYVGRHRDIEKVDPYFYLVDEHTVATLKADPGAHVELGDVFFYHGVHSVYENKFIDKTIEMAKLEFNLDLDRDDFGYINIG